METVIKQTEESMTRKLSAASRLHEDYRPLKAEVDLLRRQCLGLERLPDLHEEEGSPITPEYVSRTCSKSTTTLYTLRPRLWTRQLFVISISMNTLIHHLKFIYPVDCAKQVLCCLKALVSITEALAFVVTLFYSIHYTQQYRYSYTIRWILNSRKKKDT